MRSFRVFDTISIVERSSNLLNWSNNLVWTILSKLLPIFFNISFYLDGNSPLLVESTVKTGVLYNNKDYEQCFTVLSAKKIQLLCALQLLHHCPRQLPVTVAIPILGRIIAVHGFGRRADLLHPRSLLGLLCPAQHALLHMLVEDLLLVVAPHLRAHRPPVSTCLKDNKVHRQTKTVNARTCVAIA